MKWVYIKVKGKDYPKLGFFVEDDVELSDITYGFDFTKGEE